MIVEAAVDGCRDPPHRLPVAPRQEMCYLGVLMVWMFLCEQTGQLEEAVAQQVAAQGRGPARVAAVKAPREIGE